MKKINMNEFAKDVTLEEGGKVSLSIGQVKEVLKIAFTKLVQYHKSSAIMELLERYGDK